MHLSFIQLSSFMLKCTTNNAFKFYTIITTKWTTLSTNIVFYGEKLLQVTKDFHFERHIGIFLLLMNIFEAKIDI